MQPYIPFLIGEGGQNWPAVCSGNGGKGSTLFFLVADHYFFTIALRKHLLRGITFGRVRR